jgi:lysophospholipase L1-like esterase
MLNCLNKGALATFIFIVLSCIPAKKETITIYLIGDSTVAEYEPSRAPVAGWGMPFAKFFDSSVVVENHARGGRSTRTFLAEKRWEAVAKKLKKGDHVLMQFGHNDEATEERYKDRYTPVPDYKKNLFQFITETRAKGAVPVLVTPVTRRRFDKEGRIMETHIAYTNAVYELAKEHRVSLVDLDKKSRELLQEFGEENSKLLFMNLQPGEHPNYPDGQKDNTHFNEFGARKMAQLVLEEIRNQKLDIAERIVKP